MAAHLAGPGAPARDLAIRSKHLLTLAGEKPARDSDLFRPLPIIDNGLVIIRSGAVTYAGPWRPAELAAAGRPELIDAGDACIMPGLVNAHAHIQLSWLGGRLRTGAGFAPWLKSLIPQLGSFDPAEAAGAIEAACDGLLACGTAHVGDVGASIRGMLPLVARALARRGIGASHFCECFGHCPPLADADSVWPPRCREDIPGLLANPPAGSSFAPAGHALYSTAPGVLARARRACWQAGRIFSFHLAESPEESLMLEKGRGPLYDCYRGNVLPPGWQAPAMSPLAFAESLGLTGPGVLAVHGVQLEPGEARRLAASGSALCLCPRSNRMIGVGDAKAANLVDSGLLCCLGTDGLGSNTDLDARNEAVFLAREQGLPGRALVRMLTVNGAAALGLPAWRASLVAGAPGIVSAVPPELLGRDF